MEAAQTAGLLHLGSMAVLIAAGYIGIDRVRRDEARLFRDTLTRVSAEVKAILQGVDLLVDGVAVLDGLFDMYATHCLCHIAQVPVVLTASGTRSKQSRWRRFKNMLARQRDVPCLIYFRGRVDRQAVFILGLASMLTFFVLVASGVWGWSIGNNHIFGECCFFLYVLSIVAVFITAALAYPLLRIKETSDRLLGELAGRAREIRDRKLNDGMRKLADGGY